MVKPLRYYISDTHFGHEAIIRMDKRPFSSIDEMDRQLIDNWNSRVRDIDHVYFLGDLCYRNTKPAEWYLKQLKGYKHLVIGNHEKAIMSDNKALSYFDTVSQILKTRERYQDQDVDVIMCHYPMAEWDGYFHGAWHIYGHIHNNVQNQTYKIMSGVERSLNAGVMINNYSPVLFQELIENNRLFNEQCKR